MIHARGIGGAFGLASGKPSMKNKPVLTYARPPQHSHIEIMGDKGIFYRGPAWSQADSSSVYPQYSAFEVLGCLFYKYSLEPVMQQLKSVFLEQGLGYLMSAYDKSMVQGYRFMRKLRNLQKKLYLQIPAFFLCTNGKVFVNQLK